MQRTLSQHPVRSEVMATTSAAGLRIRAILLPAFALIALLTTIWALATPVFASPDENAHAMKAVGQYNGELLGREVAGSRLPVFDLPGDYRYPVGINCFAFAPQQSGSCGPELGSPGGSSQFPDWVSTNNPVYYYAVGWPSLFLGGSPGIYAMRIVSGLLVSLLFAAAIAVAMSSRRRRWMAAGAVFVVSPMVMFLSASINPQGAEIAAGALLTVSLLRLLENGAGEATPSRRVLWTLTVIGASVLAIARATGPLWVAILVAGVVAAMGWSRVRIILVRPRTYVAVAIVGVVGLSAVAWTLITGTLSGQAERTDAPLVGASFISGVWAMIRQTPTDLQTAAGVFGWLDTPLPTLLYSVYFAALVILVLLAIVASQRRDKLVVIGAVIVAVAVPILVQAASVSRTGIIWQGRYALFLYLSLLLLAAWAMSRSGERIASISTSVSIAIICFVIVYGMLAFAVVLHRYVVGAGASVAAMLTAPAWQPPMGWPALVVAHLLVSSLFAVWLSRIAIRSAADLGQAFGEVPFVPSSR